MNILIFLSLSLLTDESNKYKRWLIQVVHVSLLQQHFNNEFCHPQTLFTVHGTLGKSNKIV